MFMSEQARTRGGGVGTVPALPCHVAGGRKRAPPLPLSARARFRCRRRFLFRFRLCGARVLERGPVRRRTWRPSPAAAMLVLFETAAGYAIFKVSRGRGSGPRPPTCGGAEGRMKRSASGLRRELRGIMAGER